MYGYLWRFPTLYALMALFCLAYFGLAVAAAVRHRRTAPWVFIAALALLFAGNVMAVDETSALIARALRVRKEHVDPGILGTVAPIAFAAFAFAVGAISLRRRWLESSACRFYVWLAVFVAANILDRCSPGWCSTIGLPFAWDSWSDSMWGDQSWRWLRHSVAAVANMVCFVVVAVVLSKPSRSRSAV